MDEKLKNDDKYLLVVEKKDEVRHDLKGVTKMNKKGGFKTEDVTGDNKNNFLAINPNDSILETFFNKMVEQADNPSHTGFYLVSAKMLDKIIRLDFTPDELEACKVTPESFLQEKQQAKEAAKIQTQDTSEGKVAAGDKKTQSDEQTQTFQPFDENKIDKSQLDKLGIEWKDIEPNLKAMLYGHKSPQVIPMNPEMDEGIRVPTKGRLSLEELPDGSLRFQPHYYQEKPALDIPVHGILLNDQDKENLLKTGNAGRIIELEPITGQKVPAFLSLDKLTNRIEALPVEKVTTPQQIKGVDLSPEQQKHLAEGKKVLVEGMTSRNGRLFDGYIQINAADKKFDFTYDGLDRNRYAQENKQNRGQSAGGEEMQKQLFVPKKLLGVELSERQQNSLKEGKATWVQGMIKDGKGEPFNAWVKPNPVRMKFDFFKWNPDKSQAKEIKPAAGHATQVAVNSDGKTNEATKKIKEPLKSGQTQPSDDQVKKQQQNKPVIKKSSGHKL